MMWLCAVGLIMVYTLADQIREDWLTMVTPSGRYSISLGEGCESVGPGQNHWLWSDGED